MPATFAQQTSDLEAWLQRALSRTGTGAWTAVNEALDRAAQLLPTVVAQADPGADDLRRCFTLLGDLHQRVTQARQTTRDDLDQLRFTQGQVAPTRAAYTQRPALASRFGQSA